MDGKSLDITQERLNKLKEILPDAFTEGKIKCGEAHFDEFNDVEFRRVATIGELN